jgi:hypothetical protein
VNQERTAEHTVPTALQVATSTVLAWRELWQQTPSLATVFLLVAQWALETAWGKECFCWNLDNSKWSLGYDWCFYACGEELPLGAALNYQKQDPDHVHIISRYAKDGQAMASCKLLPPHPMCKFKAFVDINEAMIYRLGALRRRFNLAWPFIVAGDAAGCAHALKTQHFYTAPEHTADHRGYADGLIATTNGMGRHLPGFDPAKIETPSPPVGPSITDEDRKRVMALVSLTVENMVNELGHAGGPVES